MAAGCFPPRRLSVINVASRCQFCRRVSAGASPVCCLVIWTAWHLPLFYSSGNLQSNWSFGWFALSVFASSVLFAWLFNLSQGSVIPVLVLHTAVNAFPMPIPVMVQPDGSNLRPFQIAAGFQVFGGRCAAVLRWLRAACGKLSTRTSADLKAARQQHARGWTNGLLDLDWSLAQQGQIA